jgi:hypothetical protein
MTEEKKKKTVKKKETDAEKIAKARKKRIALAAEKQPEQLGKKDSENREDFKKYFLRLSKKLNLDKSLEEVIWIHLKAIKCDKKELFDKGIEHFGYKI